MHHLSIHVEEEIFSDDGVLSQSILCPFTERGNERLWLLPPGSYKLFGVPISISNASTELLTPYRSTTSTVNFPMKAKVKLEPTDKEILLLSDSSDDNQTPIDYLPSSPFTPTTTTFSTPPLSTAKPPRPLPSSSPVSIISCLQKLGTRKGSRNALTRVNFSTISIKRNITFLPQEFNGDILFEFSPSGAIKTQAGVMEGMDKRYDGHVWCRTKTSNIRNDNGLTFRYSACVGHLRCTNSVCPFLEREGRLADVNEIEWDGCTDSPFQVGCSPPKDSTVVCSICRFPPQCIANCMALIYYVSGAPSMTRACIHLGYHHHPVKLGVCRTSAMQAKQLLDNQIQKTPTATHSKIVLEASKEFLGEFLLGKEVDNERKPLGLDELYPVLDKFQVFTSPRVRHEVSGLKQLPRHGPLDGITKLSGLSVWQFVRESKFPGQGVGKVFVFKMSDVGPGSGLDLVKRMQPGGDLQDSWIMFDHVKRVKPWTTMACHVYDPIYCKVMTIAICDMQSEDTEAQMLLWHGLNGVVATNGFPKPKFKGFMADSAQANWNAVRIVYGSGQKDVPMKNQERTCLFHWAQSLDRVTKSHIKPDLQEQHKRLCKQYKDSSTLADAEVRYLAIRQWWVSAQVAPGTSLQDLEQWLAFWHFRYIQWGGAMQLVSRHLLCLL